MSQYKEQNRKMLIDLFIKHSYRTTSTFVKGSYNLPNTPYFMSSGELDKEQLIIIYKHSSQPLRVFDMLLRHLLPQCRNNQEISTKCLQWCKQKCRELNISTYLMGFTKKSQAESAMFDWFIQFTTMEEMFQYLETPIVIDITDTDICAVCFEMTEYKTPCNHYLCQGCSQQIKNHNGKIRGHTRYIDCPICRAQITY